MKFKNWIETFVSEKNIDIETIIEADGDSGVNFIPVGVLLDAMSKANPDHQKQMKQTLVMIDFNNGDIMHYFKHLAKAIAI
jgi:hypothetical protein